MRNLFITPIFLLFFISSPLHAKERHQSSGGSIKHSMHSELPYNEQYYKSVDGNLVHRPSKVENKENGNITADCGDGTFSYSHHHSGTCSHHGGVSHWR